MEEIHVQEQVEGLLWGALRKPPLPWLQGLGLARPTFLILDLSGTRSPAQGTPEMLTWLSGPLLHVTAQTLCLTAPPTPVPRAFSSHMGPWVGKPRLSVLLAQIPCAAPQHRGKIALGGLQGSGCQSPKEEINTQPRKPQGVSFISPGGAERL